MKHTAYISLGSNMGDRLFNFRKSIDSLTRSGKSIIKARSRLYLTEPVDFIDQDWFLNGVIQVETVLSPMELLDKLQTIQRELGRVRDKIKFGPRVLDMDIIFYDDEVISAPRLVTPHPRMHKRRFVLRPICDIYSGTVHPVLKENVQNLLDGLDDTGQKMIEYSCDF